jgi:hypothetical protein
MALPVRNMTVEATGLLHHGTRVQISSDSAMMYADLDRHSAISHAANVLIAAGITRLDIDPDGTWHAHERSN